MAAWKNGEITAVHRNAAQTSAAVKPLRAVKKNAAHGAGTVVTVIVSRYVLTAHTQQLIVIALQMEAAGKSVLR